jgi:hypothetical protein
MSKDYPQTTTEKQVVFFTRPITQREARLLARALDFDDEASAVGDPDAYPSDEPWHTNLDPDDVPSFQERIDMAGLPAWIDED